MFPYASHQEYKYNLEFADQALREVGEYAKAKGHRLTAHPGQFVQLSLPHARVVESSISELEYHAEMFARMDLNAASDGAVMVIHMGGVHGDKVQSLQRFRDNVKRLSHEVTSRLVLENDEICYNIEDLLVISEDLDIPLVLDWHHDDLYPSSMSLSELWPRVRAVWDRRGIRPKQHYSESRVRSSASVMERRAHSDVVKSLPPCVDQDIDLMLEVKNKELALEPWLGF
jgi:UV DNA damage endonuclease